MRSRLKMCRTNASYLNITAEVKEIMHVFSILIKNTRIVFKPGAFSMQFCCVIKSTLFLVRMCYLSRLVGTILLKNVIVVELYRIWQSNSHLSNDLPFRARSSLLWPVNVVAQINIVNITSQIEHICKSVLRRSISGKHANKNNKNHEPKSITNLQ